jgi:phosphate transport system substrate-binding protein
VTAIMSSGFLLVSVVPALCGTILSGAGSTFAHPIYGRWISEFQKVQPNTEIRYEPIGSEAGIWRILQGSVDFAASDGPLSDSRLDDYRKAHGTAILHFPTVLGAVVPTYNVPGLKTELKFTAQVLVDVYLGKIKRWDDPALVKLNPEAGFAVPGNHSNF